MVLGPDQLPQRLTGVQKGEGGPTDHKKANLRSGPGTVFGFCGSQSNRFKNVLKGFFGNRKTLNCLLSYFRLGHKEKPGLWVPGPARFPITMALCFGAVAFQYTQDFLMARACYLE